MQHVKKYIFQIKSLLLLALLVFSLSPCSVKDILLESVATNTSVENPLHKTRTTISKGGSCISILTAKRSIQIGFHKPVSDLDLSFFNEYIAFTEDRSSHLKSQINSKSGFQNTPPKYILFERLKLAPLL